MSTLIEPTDDFQAPLHNRQTALSTPRYEAMCRSVSECQRIDEAKDYRDRSEALRAYARQAKNRELEVQVAELKVRAEIRCGELLREMGIHGQRNTRGGDRKSKSHDGTLTLDDLGLTKNESARFQCAAQADPDAVEQAFANARQTMRPVTSAQIRPLAAPIKSTALPVATPQESEPEPTPAMLLAARLVALAACLSEFPVATLATAMHADFPADESLRCRKAIRAISDWMNDIALAVDRMEERAAKQKSAKPQRRGPSRKNKPSRKGA